MGPFADAVVIPIRLSGDPSFREVASSAQEAMFFGIANRDVPWRIIVRELESAYGERNLPLTQTWFNFDVGEPSDLQLKGLKVRSFDLAIPTEEVNLSLNDENRLIWQCDNPELLLWWDGPSLRGRFEYNCALFDDSMVAQLSQDFLSIIEAVAHDAGTQVSQVPVFGL
jgi:non-ribosomal peptide synthetase component F